MFSVVTCLSSVNLISFYISMLVFHSSWSEKFRLSNFSFQKPVHSNIENFKVKDVNTWEYTTTRSIFGNICGEAHFKDAISCRTLTTFYLISELSTWFDRPEVDHTVVNICGGVQEGPRRWKTQTHQDQSSTNWTVSLSGDNSTAVSSQSTSFWRSSFSRLLRSRSLPRFVIAFDTLFMPFLQDILVF